MLIRNSIYCLAILLSLLSIPTLIYSIKNKDKNICKGLICISIICIIYLLIDLSLLGILHLQYSFEIFLICLFALIATLLSITSLVLNFKKVKNLQADAKPQKIITIIIILIILPILFLSPSILRDKYLINNSDLILVYHSSGNGGIGDGQTFAYAIGDEFCEQFELGINLDGYYLKKFLPKNATEITDIHTNIENYEIIFNDNSILVYKDQKYICEKKHNSDYFNVSYEKTFYINHN